MSNAFDWLAFRVMDVVAFFSRDVWRDGWVSGDVVRYFQEPPWRECYIEGKFENGIFRWYPITVCDGWADTRYV